MHYKAISQEAIVVGWLQQKKIPPVIGCVINKGAILKHNEFLMVPSLECQHSTHNFVWFSSGTFYTTTCTESFDI